MKQIRDAERGHNKTKIVITKCTAQTDVRHEEGGSIHFLERLACDVAIECEEERLSKANLEVDLLDAELRNCYPCGTSI